MALKNDDRWTVIWGKVTPINVEIRLAHGDETLYAGTIGYDTTISQVDQMLHESKVLPTGITPAHIGNVPQSTISFRQKA